MAEFKCDLCGKVYKSKRSLRRHQKKVHEDVEVPLPLEDAGGREGADAGSISAGSAPSAASQSSEPQRAQAFSPKVLERALVDLGIEPENVMAHRVYPDRVVIIEGPVGFKRVWRMPGR